MSSAYPNVPTYLKPTWQSNHNMDRSENKLSTYIQNNNGDISLPCFPPLTTVNESDCSLSKVT